MPDSKVVGRFAPSPSGRMHLGNAFAALLAWLDVRSQGGTMLLRIEDLDPDRCSLEKAAQLEDDLRWLGLDWDVGGIAEGCCQSRRGEAYERAFSKLQDMGLIYPCFCTRAERLAASAPHSPGERAGYRCPCAARTEAEREALRRAGRRAAFLVRVPDEELSVTDGQLGVYRQHLRRDVGDFIVRRSDGVWAYQLAVVVDDGEMGVNRVVRGRDLLSSTPRQIWLCTTLGFVPPTYCHVPLLTDSQGRRLSKRDADLDFGVLRQKYTPQQIVGGLAYLAGLQDVPKSAEPADLVPGFTWAKVRKTDVLLDCP